MRRIGLLGLGIVLCGGCVERTLSISSTPPGALVTLNDMEVGRTPLSKRFTWYGTFDVQVRKEGYQTLNTTTPVIAPWWQWIGFDLIAELLPIRLQDEHEVSYTLKPQSLEQVDPDAIVQRGQKLREQLEGSRLPNPATQPASKPAKAGK
jgi:hypothetical protein